MPSHAELVRKSEAHQRFINAGGSGPLHMRGCGLWTYADPYIKNLTRTDMVLAARVLEAFDLVLIMERLDDPKVSRRINTRSSA